MTYDDFYASVSKYYDLYDLGLKKDANKFLKQFCDSLKLEDDLDMILKEFTHDLFENDAFGYREYRYSRLPYFLNELLVEYLRVQAYDNKMPEMRYFFELPKYDQESAQEAHEMLNRAYEHPDCDERTIFLMFERSLNFIDYATHHFPDGYIVDKSLVDEALDKCRDMIKKHNIRDYQVKEYEYYDKLCKAFDLYEADDRKQDFSVYTQKVDIEYTPIKTYYYK